jgi:chaperone required for assembly of F1-ATPase
MADDGNGWTVMLDYRTLKTPSKRPMKLPTLSLAKAIAAEWQYQVLTLVYLFSQFFFLLCSVTTKGLVF